ncbi:hypothetical protein CLOM_g2145 [Closterium sp. NIES-68]|nr:hypothetical protein CLOM_g2145 [Closterium sp. NIES-68]
MAPFSGGPERIVVAVSKDPSSRDAMKWAIRKKMKRADDMLILLHIVSRVPVQGPYGSAASGGEIYQSEASTAVFVGYLRDVVKPMMLQLKESIDPKLQPHVELKVGRSNWRVKGIMEEAMRLHASILVIGAQPSLRSDSFGTGAYFIRNKPPHMSVYVIQGGKLLLSHEVDGQISGSPAALDAFEGGGPLLVDQLLAAGLRLDSPAAELAALRLPPGVLEQLLAAQVAPGKPGKSSRRNKSPLPAPPPARSSSNNNISSSSSMNIGNSGSMGGNMGSSMGGSRSEEMALFGSSPGGDPHQQLLLLQQQLQLQHLQQQQQEGELQQQQDSMYGQLQEGEKRKPRSKAKSRKSSRDQLAITSSSFDTHQGTVDGRMGMGESGYDELGYTGSDSSSGAMQLISGLSSNGSSNSSTSTLTATSPYSHLTGTSTSTSTSNANANANASRLGQFLTPPRSRSGMDGLAAVLGKDSLSASSGPLPRLSPSFKPSKAHLNREAYGGGEYEGGDYGGGDYGEGGAAGGGGRRLRASRSTVGRHSRGRSGGGGGGDEARLSGRKSNAASEIEHMRLQAKEAETARLNAERRLLQMRANAQAGRSEGPGFDPSLSETSIFEAPHTQSQKEFEAARVKLASVEASLARAAGRTNADERVDSSPAAVAAAAAAAAAAAQRLARRGGNPNPGFEESSGVVGYTDGSTLDLGSLSSFSPQYQVSNSRPASSSKRALTKKVSANSNISFNGGFDASCSDLQVDLLGGSSFSADRGMGGSSAFSPDSEAGGTEAEENPDGDVDLSLSMSELQIDLLSPGESSISAMRGGSRSRGNEGEEEERREEEEWREEEMGERQEEEGEEGDGCELDLGLSLVGSFGKDANASGYSGRGRGIGNSNDGGSSSGSRGSGSGNGSGSGSRGGGSSGSVGESGGERKREGQGKGEPQGKGGEGEGKSKKAAAAKHVIGRGQYRVYSYEEIQAATDNFNPKNRLGEGAFGTVYGGRLHHTRVAVKVLKATDVVKATNEFQQEVEVLSQIQHPHVVMLLGCCPARHCIVYEFMACGTLEERLLCANNSPPLPWFARLRIAAEVASALLILHARPIPIVHRDLKPANILLDKNLVAKLGDVGLAKLMPGTGSEIHTHAHDSVPVGTLAYVDPEFQRTGDYGPKSDVYALGIILFDILTGRKPTTYEELEEAVDEDDEEAFRKLLDEKAGDWPIGLAMEVARMAVRCSEMRRKKRPDLESEVMPLLARARDEAADAEEAAGKEGGRSGGSGDVPKGLLCPVNKKIMVEPVLAADGYTYEKAAIQMWLERTDLSPMTNEPLPHKHLMPNLVVRDLIADWTKKNVKIEG